MSDQEARVARRKRNERKRAKTKKPARKKTPDLERKPIGLATTTKELLKALNVGIDEADADAKRKK